MLFIHNEIYENYYSNLKTGYNYELLLSVEGLELLNLRVGDLTIKDKRLSSLVRMYIDFSVCNNKIKTWVGATPDMEQYFWEEVQKWRKNCRLDIEDYEKEFCKDESLKSEIEVEWIRNMWSCEAWPQKSPKRLKELSDKGEIPKHFIEMANILKYFGNIGVHSSEKNMPTLPVDTIDDFFIAIIEYVYGFPNRIEEIKKVIRNINKSN